MKSMAEEKNSFNLWQWIVNAFTSLMSMFTNVFPNKSATSETAPSTPVTPPATAANTLAVTQTPAVTPTPAQTVSPTTNTVKPETKSAPAASPLSYATKDSNTEWLNPKDYEGKIKIPQKVLDDAKERGEKGVYALVTIKAGQHKDGHPYALGFHVFQEITTDKYTQEKRLGKQTLIPMMSGGAKAVSASNFNDSDAVESSKYAPLPGLLTDSTGKKGDGLNAVRTITNYKKEAATSMIEGKKRKFEIFVTLDDGKSTRSDIGVHNDFLDTGESKGKPWGSQGCPVMPDEYIPEFKKQMQQLGIGTGDKYYVLDRDETVTSPTSPRLAAASAQLK
jgi:hypothetical protein